MNVRFGVLAFATLDATGGILLWTLQTTDTDSWYFGNTVALALVLGALTVYGLYTATDGRVFKSGDPED